MPVIQQKTSGYMDSDLDVLWEELDGHGILPAIGSLVEGPGSAQTSPLCSSQMSYEPHDPPYPTEDEAFDFMFEDASPTEHQILSQITDTDEQKHYTVAHLEAFSLSLLAQLSTSLSGAYSSHDASEGIILQLADRKPRKKKLAPDSAPPLRTLYFPRRRVSQTRAIASALRIVDLSHEALLANNEVTKRDIFYKDVHLFQKQATVDMIVDDIASTFELQRSDLKIRASPKGLFASSMVSLGLRAGGLIVGHDRKGSLIPPGSDISYIQMHEQIGWVLVVEKEAVFQTLCSSGLASDPALLLPGLIITGKGYPDLATRELINKLSQDLPTSIPILALVDADPYGIEIMSVYKFGSKSMEHEGKYLAASRIEWLGVFSSEIERLDIDPNQLVPITLRDHMKVNTAHPAQAGFRLA